MSLAASDISREVDRAFTLIGGMSLLLLIAITAAMVIITIRFSRNRSRTTVQIEGHKWLEITWLVVPTIIVMWMFAVGYRGFALMREVPEGAMVVEVTGRQWMWSFHYPKEKLYSAEMVVPVSTPVKVELTSLPNDVVHSFYIPDFRVKEDVLPGRKTFLWFEAERVGDYTIFCAEFCGKDHSQMISMLRVVSRDDFEKWIRSQEAKRYRPLVFDAVVDADHSTFGEDELNIRSGALYKTSCASCHGVGGDGSGLPGEARNFTTAQDWKQSPKVTDIYRTLTEGVAGTQMRAYPNFTPWERVALAHEVRSFLQQGAPVDTREDYDVLVKQYELDKIRGPKETISIERAMEIISNTAETDPAPDPDASTAPQPAGSSVGER